METEVLQRPDGSFELDEIYRSGNSQSCWGLGSPGHGQCDSGRLDPGEFGDFPEPGQSILADGLKVTVLAMDGLRVERLLVEPFPEDRES